MLDYRFHISEDWGFDGYKIYLSGVGAEYTSHYFTIKDGRLQVHDKEEGSIIPEPLLVLTEHTGKQILQKLAEGLAKAGFVAEVDNKERITAQALAEERKEQIEYLRKFNEDIIREKL